MKTQMKKAMLMRIDEAIEKKQVEIDHLMMEIADMGTVEDPDSLHLS